MCVSVWLEVFVLGRCVYVDTRCSVCALGSVIGVGSEFAVTSVIGPGDGE